MIIIFSLKSYAPSSTWSPCQTTTTARLNHALPQPRQAPALVRTTTAIPHPRECNAHLTSDAQQQLQVLPKNANHCS